MHNKAHQAKQYPTVTNYGILNLIYDPDLLKTNFNKPYPIIGIEENINRENPTPISQNGCHVCKNSSNLLISRNQIGCKFNALYSAH